MVRPYVGILACIAFTVLGCLSIPANAQQVLYVGNEIPPGGSQQYTLPISGSSTPNFTIGSDRVLAMAPDSAGNLVTGSNPGQLKFFTAPLSAASVPSATFNNGAGPGVFQFAFTPAGDFFVSTEGTTINKFTHPFTNASIPSQSITPVGLTGAFGVALDAAQNLYISNAGGGGSNLLVLAPPYTGAPILTPLIPGTSYRKVALSATQLFVGDDSGILGKVDVYTLPITPASAPAFSITNDVRIPEAVALDQSGNLYVGNLNNSSVTVYQPPFSAASTAVTTMNASGGPAIFGIAVGNSGPSLPAISRAGLMALCALLAVIGLVAVRIRT